MKVPVALIIFNRPDLAGAVINAIRAYRPTKLYVIADGPRPGRPQEPQRCDETRKVVLDQVSWDCQITQVFSARNLGCRRRVVSGLDVVYENEERAIVLEDDTLPTVDFFEFCEVMLSRYAADRSIFSITGTNIVPLLRWKPTALVTPYTHIWGWATWSRSWRAYDRNLACIESPEFRHKLRQVLRSRRHALHWLRLLERVKAGEIDTWDYQLQATAWNLGAKCVTPPVNLVSNIGFRIDATHTHGASLFDRLPTSTLEPSVYGAAAKPSALYDWCFRNLFHNPGAVERVFVRMLLRLRSHITRRL